jgi:protein-disulfide isomerase
METIIAIVLLALSLGSSQLITESRFDSLQQSRLPDGGFVVGNPNAPVTIIEFGDFACPHCIEYLSVMDQFFDKYVKTGKAKFEFRIVPTAGGQLTAFIGTMLVCMEQQKAGIFWKGYDLLYQEAEAGTYDANTMRRLSSKLGVNYADALACAQTEKQLDRDMALAIQLDIRGTPSLRVRDASGNTGSLVVDGQSYDQGGPSFDIIKSFMAQFP